MATILIVDDRPSNREFLATVLGYCGHRLLEAGDGAEALHLTREERPDLVIADILMPTMDGYEFVRQLRNDPAIAATRVLFYTAHYHETEARALASACGVSGVLTKPCEPGVVLQTVEEILGIGQTPARTETTVEFDREHLRLVTDKLSQKAEELRKTNERLNALVDLGLRLGSEREPARLLQGFCDGARQLIGTRYAVIGVTGRGEDPLRYCFASGMSPEMFARLGTPDPRAGAPGRLLKSLAPERGVNPSGNPVEAGFPARFPPIHTWMGIPIQSLTRTYGWVVLIDKLGAESFSDEDERLLTILAGQLGRIYENGSLYAELVRQSSELNQEVAERSRAEMRFRSLVETAPDAMVIVNESGAIVLANTRTVKLFGYEREELIGRPVELLIPERLHQQSIDFRRPLLVEPPPSSDGEGRELAGQRKDGSEFPVEISLSPLRTDEGVLITMAIRNITLRRQNEEAMRASEALLRSAFDHTNVAMVLTNPEGRFVRANAAFASMFGYSPEEILHRGMSDITHPDDQAATLAQREELLDGRKPFFQMENRYLHKDGHVLWGLTNVSLVRGPRGEVMLYVAQVQDITERKRTEDTLRAIQQRLEHVICSSPAVIYTLSITDDRLRGLSWISDNVRGLLGYSPEEALEPHWWLGNIHPDDRQRVKDNTNHSLSLHGHATDEYRFLHRDGSYRWLRSEMRLLSDSAGKAAEVVGSWSDVTERKQLEDQILQAQKMEAIGKLAGGVAHDFNNLLTVITGYCDILMADPDVSLRGREFLEEIHSAGDRAAALTRQLLTFSRKAVTTPVVLDPNGLLANLHKLLSRLIGEDIELRVIPGQSLGKVKADPGQLEQVVMNLVVNARDAMPRGGKLTIRTANVELDEEYAARHPQTRTGLYVLLEVVDTGCGMDDATRARIFEPFFTTKPRDQGTGLGLSVVHGIVQQSGGRIDVTSQPGVGSTFRVYLPRVNDSAPISRLLSLAPVRRGFETVLLVEDESGVRALARLILEKYGYRVLEARDGLDALGVARSHTEPIHLMVTDMVMPNMSGWELAQQLAPLRPDMKVLYLSGYTDDALVHHGDMDADTPFLQKPFTSESLANKVRELLDG
jgi:PAS domain S-box-containing protein